MAKPQNREQFKDLVLRKSGMPVIELEIDDEQIEDAIDEALKYFHDYHFDGSERAFYRHQVTEQDITNGYITIPSDIHFITKVMSFGRNALTNNIFGAKYQFALNDFFNITSMNMSYWNNTMTYIGLIEEFFSTMPGTVFNRHANRLYITMNWKENLADEKYIVVECTRIIDPEVYSDVWNDRWLSNYATILVRRQIGLHLMKYNITLPGNVTYNGESIYNIAQQEKEKMEESVVNDFSIPPFFIVG